MAGETTLILIKSEYPKSAEHHSARFEGSKGLSGVGISDAITSFRDHSHQNTNLLLSLAHLLHYMKYSTRREPLRHSGVTEYLFGGGRGARSSFGGGGGAKGWHRSEGCTIKSNGGRMV